MTNITLYVPDSIYKKMKKYKELKWSEIAREAIEEKIKQLEEADMRIYGLKRLLKEGEEADDLFKF